MTHAAQAAERIARDRDALWSEFAASQDAAAQLSCWLALLCSEQLAGVAQAGLWLADGGNALREAARWRMPARPHPAQPSLGTEGDALAAAAQRSIAGGGGQVLRFNLQHSALPDDAPEQPLSCALISYPLDDGAGGCGGVVVLELDRPGHAQLIQAARRLHWASAWPQRHFLLQQRAAQARDAERWQMALDLSLGLLRQASFREAAFALVNLLAEQFGAASVSLGLQAPRGLRLCAVSRTAWFEPASPWARAMQAAMEEVRDAREALIWPSAHSALNWPALHALSTLAGGHGLLLVPLQRHGLVTGVIALERDAAHPFDEDDRHRLEGVAPMLALQLDALRRADRGLPVHARDALLAAWRRLIGPRHYTWKAGAAITGMGLALLCFWTRPYEVAADTVIEGERQRVIAAPFEGFVVRAEARAGDVVAQGQELARMDERDLLLERQRWHSEREQALRKLRDAESRRELADVQVLSAQAAQAQAQLSWAEAGLERASIRAPFAAVVVTGDLSQSLGAPVETGKTLFELAPLDDYRVVLNVDERDIAFLRTGQRGELRLTGMPGEALPIVVSRIHPVASARDGRNQFRVEARLPQGATRLRPGMEGAARVATEPRPLLWIWTHRFSAWLRLQWWRFLP